MKSFTEKRRQKYIDQESFENTVRHFEKTKPVYQESLRHPERYIRGHAHTLFDYASSLWEAFQIRYTAGEDLRELSHALSEIVDAFDDYVKKNEEVPDEKYLPPFTLNNFFENYVDFLHLICATILLHREDLLTKIFSWIEGGEYDGTDAVLEELFNFYFPDRPSPDEWLWAQPYQKLLDVVDSTSADERSKLMKRYVKGWYSSMKGKASFWNAHTKITPDFSPYFGYWTMCAAAFTYLLDIDDTSYRNEEVYPKDLVDFARSIPRNSLRLEDGAEILRVEGGQACPREGTWFSPAKADSTQHFNVGEIMPVFDAAEYGQTIWQWLPRQ